MKFISLTSSRAEEKRTGLDIAKARFAMAAFVNMEFSILII
jgi:hypothetical protein